MNYIMTYRIRLKTKYILRQELLVKKKKIKFRVRLYWIYVNIGYDISVAFRPFARIRDNVADTTKSAITYKN